MPQARRSGSEGGLLAQPDADALRARIEAEVARYERDSGASVGLCVIDLAAGRTLAGLRADEPFVPASNQKLLTAAFALAELGPEFHFTTTVLACGDDVVLRGGFDPLLGDPRLAAEAGRSIYHELDRWALAVREAVGATISGDLIVDAAGPLPRRHPDWPADQLGRWYAAPVAALNFHDNCFDVTFDVDAGRAVPHVTPASRLIRVVNEVRLGRRHLWSLRVEDAGAAVVLRGQISQPARDPLSVPADDPPMLLARVFLDRLSRAGVTLAGRIRLARIAEGLDARLLCQSASPLPDVLQRANKRSLNVAAECLLLAAGDGTWPGSGRQMRLVLGREFGLAPAALTVSDGSGLSRANRVTPAAVARVLAAMPARRGADAFLASLPVGGVDGTLERRFRGTPAQGRVRAKTGYVAGASCLSGYVLSAGGQPAVAFSVLVNDVPPGKAWQAKDLQDRIATLLVEAVGK